MAVRTQKEILNSLKAVLGDNKSDEVIALLEDVSDTFADRNDETDWKAKFEENDKAWHDKYYARFFGSGSDDEEEHENENHEHAEDEHELATSFDQLFEEVK